MNPRRESRREAYDVVVVGSGLGGLSAAALLARAGWQVLVVERHDRPGGYAHGFQRRRYRFDSAVHATSGCESGDFGGGALIDEVLRALQVRDMVTFRPVDPFCAGVLPGMRMAAPVGVEAFVTAHAQHFPAEERGLRQLLRLCTRFNREVKRLPPDATVEHLQQNPDRFPLHGEYGDATVSQVLDEFLADDRLKTALTVQWGYLGLPPSQLAFAHWSPMLISFIRAGTYYAVGGFQTLVDAFASGLTRYGGELLLRSGVRRILVEDGRTVGVMLDNGQRISAPVVISNADAMMTFEELVGTRHLPEAYLEMLRGLRPSLSAVTTYFATDVDVRAIEGAEHEMFVFAGWDHDEAYAAIMAGRPDMFIVSIPTLLDPSLAPEGEHLLTVTTLIPYELAKSWRESKDHFLADQRRQLLALFPSLDGRIVFAESATPRTMERYTLNTAGAIYGWAATPEQSGVHRLSRRTPIEGLYLSGHWTQPGGGVMPVIVSGVQTAQLLLGSPSINALLTTDPVSLAATG